jgi:sugar lactone lactonase YvrE
VAEIVDGAAHPLDPAIMQALTSVQGLRAGPDETLYALDSGVRALTGIDRERAALWAIDVAASPVARRYAFPTQVALPTTYLNDLTVDHARGVAYLVDAGGEEPNGLIRLDLDTGASRRLLHDHHSVRAAASPRPGGILVAGAPLSPDQPVRVGATGATLGRDHDLFWNRADELFSIDLAVLDSGDLRDIDAAIVTWPPRPFASDGLDRDASGRVLLTDLANSGVQRLDPATGRYQLIAADPEISWPDGVCAAPDGSAYVTSSQIHRSTMFGAPDTRQPPFGVYRLRPQQDDEDRMPDPPPGADRY